MLETVTLYLPADSRPAAELAPKKAKEPSFGLIDAAPRVEVTSAGFGGEKDTTMSSPGRTLTGCPLSSRRPFTLAPVVPIGEPPGRPQPKKQAAGSRQPAVKNSNGRRLINPPGLSFCCLLPAACCLLSSPSPVG